MFFNSTQDNLTLYDVSQNIKRFIDASPQNEYKLAVGSDSQVKGSLTCFTTGIHLHRLGCGAWCCIRKIIYQKKYLNLREKISKETQLTYEITSSLNELLIDYLCEKTNNYKSFNIKLEAHIDIGFNGASRKLIREMISYFEGSGIDPKIKPDSVIASSYANKYSKNFSYSKNNLIKII